jgi:hypothetical protein
MVIGWKTPIMPAILPLCDNQIHNSMGLLNRDFAQNCNECDSGVVCRYPRISHQSLDFKNDSWVANHRHQDPANSQVGIIVHNLAKVEWDRGTWSVTDRS